MSPPVLDRERTSIEFPVAFSRRLILDVHWRRDREKLGEMETLLAKYSGKEIVLLEHVCKKYGEDTGLDIAVSAANLVNSPKF